MNDNNQTKLPPKNDQNSNQNDQYQEVLNKYADIVGSQPPIEESLNTSSETIDKNIDQVKNSLINSSQIEPIKTEKPNQSETTPQNPEANINLNTDPATPPVLSHNIDIDETETFKNPVISVPEPPKPEMEKPQDLPPIPEPQKTPEELKSELLNIINTPTSNNPPSPDPVDAASAPPSKKGVAPYKIFFFISLFVFLGVAGALVYNLFFAGKSDQTSNNPIEQTPVPTETLLAGDYKCSLNDQKYKTGEYFQTADGCNTCTCKEDGTIDCTDKACPATKSATVVTPTKSATTSSVPKDWKTYTDSIRNFSINYPSKWQVDSKPDSGTNRILSLSSPEKLKSLNDPNHYEGYIGDDVNIQFYKNYKSTLTGNKNIEDYLKIAFSNSVKVIIAGVTAYKVDESGMAGVYPEYFLVRDNDIFLIGSNTEISSIETQIINSLKFN